MEEVKAKARAKNLTPEEQFKIAMDLMKNSKIKTLKAGKKNETKRKTNN